MDLTLATVLAVHNQFAAVRTDEGDGVATLAGRLRRSRPVVGDVVGLRTDHQLAVGEGRRDCLQTLPRLSCTVAIAGGDAGRPTQVS